MYKKYESSGLMVSHKIFEKYIFLKPGQVSSDANNRNYACNLVREPSNLAKGLKGRSCLKKLWTTDGGSSQLHSHIYCTHNMSYYNN